MTSTADTHGDMAVHRRSYAEFPSLLQLHEGTDIGCWLFIRLSFHKNERCLCMKNDLRRVPVEIGLVDEIVRIQPWWATEKEPGFQRSMQEHKALQPPQVYSVQFRVWRGFQGIGVLPRVLSRASMVLVALTQVFSSATQGLGGPTQVFSSVTEGLGNGPTIRFLRYINC